uniref:F-box protein 47 n=1 Tax=Leptobrachium leishanense TaxID=445787 RepID=A0A8C5Q2X8_9ANUR
MLQQICMSPKLILRSSTWRFRMAYERHECLDMCVLGHFQAMPMEICDFILEYLSVSDISTLSLVSKSINKHVLNYISSTNGGRRLFRQDFHTSGLAEGKSGTSILEHYRSLGLLFKRCTFLMATRQRLKYVRRMLCDIPCFKLCGCRAPLQCLGLQCCGSFLKILTAGWDEYECHKVYNFLCDLTNLTVKMQNVLNRKPGSAEELEWRVRLYCRNVMLDHWTVRSVSAFWLSRLLKPWPAVHQARLLYIIFGPVSATDGHVLWTSLSEGVVDMSSLEGLADALRLLYSSEAREWTAQDVTGLLDELSVMPQAWLLENNVRLLILCGNEICFMFLAGRAVTGHTADLARTVVFLVLVCEKDFYSMKWAVKTVQRVCKMFRSNAERRNFLKIMENAFAQVFMDLLGSVISGGRGEDDSNFQTLFCLVKAQANFHKEILYLTLNCLPV